MSKLRFANGVTLTGSAGAANNRVLLKLSAEDVRENFFLFSDQDACATIEFLYGAYKTVFHNYNKFSSMEPRDESTAFIIWMAPSENPSIEYDVPTVPARYLPKEN